MMCMGRVVSVSRGALSPGTRVPALARSRRWAWVRSMTGRMRAAMRRDVVKLRSAGVGALSVRSGTVRHSTVGTRSAVWARSAVGRMSVGRLWIGRV